MFLALLKTVLTIEGIFLTFTFIMEGFTLHIKNPNSDLLKFLSEEKERKKRLKQELMEVADLFFPEIKTNQ